jgi:regulator of sigma E protease
MSFVLSAVQTLASFALLISTIVFVHEMGHLIVGKLLGVKAIRFSLGFGPKLFGFTVGETEYRFSLLPLGGYVKFAGDNPLEELAPEDRGRGFLEQPPAKKAAIAFAGPAANFVAAVALYFIVNVAPHHDLAPMVGFVKPQSPAAVAGLQAGDRVLAVDGDAVTGWTTLQEKIRSSVDRPGQPLHMRVARDGHEQDITITPAVHEETNPLETVKHGRIGISAAPRAAEVTVTGPDTPAAQGGLRTFDLVTRLDGQPVANYEVLAKKLSSSSAPVKLEVLRREAVDAPGATVWSSRPVSLSLPAPATAGAYGIEASDLTLFVVQPGSAAAEAGLQRGDRVLTVAGKPALAWYDEVETARHEAMAQPLAFTVRREGKEVAVTVRQHLKKARDEAGVRVDTPDLGAAPDAAVFSVDSERVWVRWSVPEALRRSVMDMASAVRGQALGLSRIITGHISSEAIGGPIMIADVARRAADEGWRAFVYMMGAVSVVLGVMNLIPLPVLDGFHVLSAAIEAVRRKPLSLRFREVANVVGIALLLSLMLFAFKNDIVRKAFE